MSAATTLASAISNGFDRLSDRDVKLCILQGASSGGAGTTFGDYSGGQPTFTPASGTGLAVDTSTGTLWQYYGSAWH